MVGLPPARHSAYLWQYLGTVRATSSLLRRMQGVTIASEKLWLPRELFKPLPGTEPVVLARTGDRPPALNSPSLTAAAFRLIAPETFSLRTPRIVAFGKWLPLPEIFGPSLETERTGLAGTAGQPLVRSSIFLSEHL